MNSLEKVENSKIESIDSIMSDVSKLQNMSRKLLESKHFQKMGEDGIFAICMAAKSNGISIHDALNGELYYVQGRVGMGYEAMNKYIRQAGHSVVIKHLDDKSCTLIGKRKDTGDTAELTYDLTDAKKAGKSYDKYPKAMLFARCLSMLKRFLFPDVLTKIYEKGELEDIKENPPILEADVKPLYIESISAEQAEHLQQLFEGCSKEAQEGVLKIIKKKFNCDSLNQLPENTYQEYADMLIERYKFNQKKLAMAEMENAKVEPFIPEEGETK